MAQQCTVELGRHWVKHVETPILHSRAHGSVHVAKLENLLVCNKALSRVALRRDT